MQSARSRDSIRVPRNGRMMTNCPPQLVACSYVRLGPVQHASKAEFDLTHYRDTQLSLLRGRQPGQQPFKSLKFHRLY